jgi:hypothetical protein
MRNVVLYELISLDGVAEEPGEGEWFVDAGERLFDDSGDLQRFELVDADRSGGCLLLHYRRGDRVRSRTASAAG